MTKIPISVKYGVPDGDSVIVKELSGLWRPMHGGFPFNMLSVLCGENIVLIGPSHIIDISIDKNKIPKDMFVNVDNILRDIRLSDEMHEHQMSIQQNDNI